MWTSGKASHIGPFTVKPWLTDRSACDAHMLLIEAAGQRSLYSGDFPWHDRNPGFNRRTTFDFRR